MEEFNTQSDELRAGIVMAKQTSFVEEWLLDQRRRMQRRAAEEE